MSEDAERSVIGSLLLDPQAISEVGPWLKAGAFHSWECELAYEACLVCWKDRVSIDLVTISHGYKALGKFELMSPFFLSECLMACPTSVHVDHYARMVAKEAKKRAIRRLGVDLVGSDPETYQRLYQASVEEIESLEPEDDGMHRFEHSIPRMFDALEREWSGEVERDVISTGFRSLDYMLDGGLSPEEYLILAARPSIGKTAFAMQLAMNYARSEALAAQRGFEDMRSAVIFSAEMSEQSLLMRALSESSSVPISDMKTGRITDHGRSQLRAIRSFMERLPMVIDDRPRPTTDQMLKRLDQYQRKHGQVRLVVFDYIELAGDSTTNRNANEEQRISSISKGFKKIGKETGASIVVLSQLNRNVEDRPPYIPRMSDLRQSGALEQDADRVLFIYRQDYYEEQQMFANNPKLIIPEKRGVADVIVAKNREGTKGIVPLRFSPSLTAFSSMEDKPR